MGMPIIKPGTITREDAVGDIIESIAMEETALAHILNAESEKLMRVIDDPNSTPDDLLQVNRSVKTTLGSISRLELQLQAKLALFAETICQ